MILLLTSQGENVAARNLRQALDHLAPHDLQLEVLDLLDSSYGRFDGFFPFLAAPAKRKSLWQPAGRSLENWAKLRNALRESLRGRDVVVATSPVYGLLLDEIYRDGRARDFTFVALVLEGDPAWARMPADFFAVTSEASARELTSAGVPEKKIRIFGFPVQSFKGTAARVGKAPHILYLINNAWKKAPKLLDRLLEQPEWTITACLDPDIDLEEMVRAKAASAPGRLEVIGHLRNLPRLLREHHVVISRASTAIVQEAIAARCPLVVPKIGSAREESNFDVLRQANAGVETEKPRDLVDWLARAFRDEGKLLALWRKNIEPLGKPDGAVNLGRFLLQEAAAADSVPALRALPSPSDKTLAPMILPRRLPKQLLLCDLHTHSTWSDGKLTIPEMVDFYGQRGFDCLCVTDHLCDPKRLLGKLVNLTGLVIPPGELEAYFEAIEREKKRAWSKYDLLLMTGLEFNKDGYTAKTSTHLLGIDLKQPIDPSLDLKLLIGEIHAQGGLAIASHPHETKSHWGRDTLYLWEHVDEYAPLLDAWEVANRDDIFNPVGLKKLPFIASSDFHKPKHIQSWKTLLFCEKEAEAIKHCIRVNRDVSLTLYRDHRFGLEEALPVTEETVESEPAISRVGAR
jgi:predicted metal-dependent phosphoesterase TrpH